MRLRGPLCSIDTPVKEFEDLKAHIALLGSAVVGFSGGTDSTLVARAATDALGERALCVTVESCLSPRSEIEDAARIARDLGLRHALLIADPLASEEVSRNEPDRCYHCKLTIFGLLKQFAVQHGCEHVLDGSNADDENDYRPGNAAAQQLGIRSPLRELGWSRKQVRDVSRQLGLPTWNKPSSACLASRIPYGVRITPEILAQVEKAEAVLRGLGFTQLRVRHCGDTARIELTPCEMDRLVHPGIRELILERLRAVGYAFVSLDLQGYRTGSLNEVLKGR